MDMELEPNIDSCRNHNAPKKNEDQIKYAKILQEREMIDVMKEKFDIPLNLEENTLKSPGKKWRDWKSELRAKHFDPKETTTRQILKRLEREKELRHPLSRANLFSIVYFDSNGNLSSDGVAEKSLELLRVWINMLWWVGKRLGSHWCATHANVVIDFDEELMRPYKMFRTIGDAI
ncbi:Transposase, Tnp1/En/Spm-like [Dillenia turbinata]|uniref:Transposase, Tnp1/En/Spm-like n=1 Tax=Dillenia turbinata TaxID=194707 RepID=A0AAN8ZQE9_9MAGN